MATMNGIEALEEQLEKAKYTKRTGTPGNYQYEYADGKQDKDWKEGREKRVAAAKREAEVATSREIAPGVKLQVTKTKSGKYVATRAGEPEGKFPGGTGSTPKEALDAAEMAYRRTDGRANYGPKGWRAEKSMQGLDELQKAYDDGKPGESLKEVDDKELLSTHQGLMARMKQEPEDKAIQARHKAIAAELKRRGKDPTMTKGYTMEEKDISEEKKEDDKDKDKGESTESMCKECGKKHTLGKCMMKSLTGLEGLNEVLQKAGVVGKDDSQGSKPASTLPSGTPTMTAKGGEGAGGVEVARPADGGKIDGEGETTAKQPQPQSHQAQIGKVDQARTQVLSPDDATVAKYVEEGYMGEGMMKGETPDLTNPMGISRDQMYAQQDKEMAQGAAQLRKGNEDVTHHPYSNNSIHADSDANAERLAKGETFYAGMSPTMAPPKAVISQGTLCKSCGSEYTAMLTACPECGDGMVEHGSLCGTMHKSTVILEDHRDLPVKPNKDKDVLIG